MEKNFGEQLVTRGSEPIPSSLPNGERSSAAKTNSSNANENEADYIIARDETNYVDHEAHSRNERLTDDVTKRNEASETPRNAKSDWPNPAFPPKTQGKSLPNSDEKLENDENVPERNPINENDAQKSPNRRDDIFVPGISENDARNGSQSPRGGKYNLRPNPNPKLLRRLQILEKTEFRSGDKP